MDWVDVQMELCAAGREDLALWVYGRLEYHSRLKNALKLMTQLEPCDCGCPGGAMPILMKPHHYYAIAKEALGVGFDESRDAGQNGTCARSHETPANSDADCACRDSEPTPNVKVTRPPVRDNQGGEA